MPQLLALPSFIDSRGQLTVIEKLLPFPIRRVFYVTEAKGTRAGSRHLETKLAVVMISGSMRVLCEEQGIQSEFILNSSEQCLIIVEKVWHQFDQFSKDAIFLVMASREYDPNDDAD